MKVSPTTKGYSAPRAPKPPKFDKSIRQNSELIVAPLYDEYLLKNPEPVYDAEIVAKVMAELVKQPRDRRRSFSASSAGYCKRRQELAFLGVGKPGIIDSRGVRIFNNGTFIHLRWQLGLLSAGILTGTEVTADLNNGLFRATLDGVGVAKRGSFKGRRFLWEHKGRMSFSYAAQERNGTPDPKTRKQVAMQMYLTDYEVASVTNENKDTQAVSEFVIERNDEEIKDAKQELDELALAIDRQKLHPMLPECVKQNASGEFYKCPFGGPLGPCLYAGSWPITT
jgi:hypothetical protein